MTTGQGVCDATRMWLAVRVRELWKLAHEDVQRACRELDRLVADFGRIPVARALSDAGLQPKNTVDAAAQRVGSGGDG